MQCGDFERACRCGAVLARHKRTDLRQVFFGQVGVAVVGARQQCIVVAQVGEPLQSLSGLIGPAFEVEPPVRVEGRVRRVQVDRDCADRARWPPASR